MIQKSKTEVDAVMLSQARNTAKIYLVAVALFATPLYAANKPAQQGESGPPETSASSGQASVPAAARQVILNNLPQAEPYHGKPRAMPDQKEPIESDEIKTTGKPIPGYQPQEPSPMPQTESQRLINPDTAVVLQTFAGGSEASCGFFIPSDHALATNDHFEVQVLNSCIYVFNTNGVVSSGFPKNLNAFFGVNGADAVGDPRALYDWRSKRFVIVAEDFTANNFQVAASQTSDPTGGWWTYTISANAGGLSGSADFPMVGQTVGEAGDGDGAVYLSWDRFGNSGFQDNVVWILPKTPMYGGSSFSFHFFYNLKYNSRTIDHLQPANVINRGDLPRVEFLVNTLDFNFNCVSTSPCNGMVIWALYNGVPHSGSPSLNGKFVATNDNYIYPVTAAQPNNPSGSACALNTGNAGITSEVFWTAGDLYFAFSTAALNGQASDGWIYVQVHPTLSDAAPPTVTAAAIRNEICWGCSGFYGDSTYSEYYPAAQPDEEGNVAIVFNASGASNYASTAYVSSRATHATGGFADGGSYLSQGQTAYCQTDQYGRNRWGDYTATYSLTTAIQTRPTFWFAGQFSDAGENWETTIGKIGYTSVTQP